MRQGAAERAIQPITAYTVSLHREFCADTLGIVGHCALSELQWGFNTASCLLKPYNREFVGAALNKKHSPTL